jgi:glycosyltransferase involved in cell wall biosynthesis
MIGFLNDDYEKELKSFISQQPHPEIFHSFGFLNHNQIRQYYSAADIGLWLKAAISIQEAMGTGLQVVLENKDVVSHLLEGGVNGWYFEKNTFKETLETAVMKLNKLGVNEKINYRMNIVEMNTKKLSYNNIAKKMIDDL